MAIKNIRNILRQGLIPVAILPFILFDKAALLSFGNPAWWLIGYPLVVALLFNVLTPFKGKLTMVRTGQAMVVEEEDDHEADSRRRLAYFTDPAFSHLAGNDFHRSW